MARGGPWSGWLAPLAWQNFPASVLRLGTWPVVPSGHNGSGAGCRGLASFDLDLRRPRIRWSDQGRVRLQIAIGFPPHAGIDLLHQR
jgi:hypothetical protein